MASFTYSSSDSDQNALIDEVEYHADQVTATGQTVGINRDSVYNQLVKAMRAIFTQAPRRAIDDATSDGSAQGASNNASRTEIELPDDFLRFMNLKLAEWKRDVFELVDPRSNRVRMQYNSFTGGDIYNPVAAKVATPNATNGHSLYCWPQDSTPTVETFAYLPELAPESAPEILQEAIILQATSYVLAAQKEQGWQMMQAAAQQLLQQIQVGEQPMVQRAFEQVQSED